MKEVDELDLFKEKKNLEDNYKDSLKELRKLSSFLKNYIKMHEEIGKKYEKTDNQKEKDIPKDKDNQQNKNKEKESTEQKNQNSLLFSNINNIYESFDLLVKNSQNLFLSMSNDLVIPLDDFIQNQLNFYNKNLNNIRKITANYQSLKSIVDNSKNNYYRASYISNKFDSNEIDNSIFRGENDLMSKRDNLIKKKMIARNDEFIHRREHLRLPLPG